MEKVLEYYRHAKECRDIARFTSSSDYKTTLEDMAKLWENLAKGREKRLARFESPDEE